jgi:hypothetical protein
MEIQRRTTVCKDDLLERDYVVAWLDVRDALAHALDDSAALMAKDYGEGAFGVLPGQRVGIWRVSGGPVDGQPNGPVWQTPV